MAVVITLTGASQCGKSTIVDLFNQCENKNFVPYLIPKYVTRELRDTDGDDVIGGGIPKTCDLVWELYGQRYGIHFDTIYETLSQGKCPIIIVNDIRIIQDLKTALGSQVVSIFMYRKKPELQSFIKKKKRRFSKQLSPEVLEQINKTATTRYNKALTIYRIYIENLPLFDNVILNTGTIEQSKRQVQSIVSSIAVSNKYLEGEE